MFAVNHPFVKTPSRPSDQERQALLKQPCSSEGSTMKDLPLTHIGLELIHVSVLLLDYTHDGLESLGEGWLSLREGIYLG